MRSMLLILLAAAFIAVFGIIGANAAPEASPFASPLANPLAEADPEPINQSNIMKNTFFILLFAMVTFLAFFAVNAEPMAELPPNVIRLQLCKFIQIKTGKKLARCP
ncbi:hypothetical protein M0804_004576 [Polistes exclamans]|nr:hypothetical protein M0804_004576 [Polistes exclamans]